MKAKAAILISLLFASILIFTSARVPSLDKPAGAIIPRDSVKRYLYVAVPGIRDYLGYRGHGILVFDIDNHHRFVKTYCYGWIPS